MVCLRWAGFVSIHAPAREATALSQRWRPSQSGFKPRPRTGGDHHPQQLGPVPDCFNPRPRTGGDRRFAREVAQGSTFQSTPPHGRRLPPCMLSKKNEGFNPRPRTGGDRAALQVVARSKFQSTPPHGRRPARCLTWTSCGWFQSTPPHGRRPLKDNSNNHAVCQLLFANPNASRQRSAHQCRATKNSLYRTKAFRLANLTRLA